MNNATYISGDTREFTSQARKAFIAIDSKYTGLYYYEGNDTNAFLKTLNTMVNSEYCELQLCDKAAGAKGVAAACRSALYALAPFEEDLRDEYGTLNRVTNFLELSIQSDASYNA